MAVTYNNTVKDNRMTQVLNAIDAGAGAGYIEICTAAYALVLATIALSDPCGSVGSQALTLTAPASDLSVDADGTAAVARIKDSTGTVVVSGLTVGAGGYQVRVRRTPDKRKKLFDAGLEQVLREAYREILLTAEPPVKKQAAKVVRPFLERGVKPITIPPVDVVDWGALEQDAKRVLALLELWQSGQDAQDAQDAQESEEALLLLMAA